jgi:hypothetical protein
VQKVCLCDVLEELGRLHDVLEDRPLQHTSYNMQRTAYNMGRTSYNMQRTNRTTSIAARLPRCDKLNVQHMRCGATCNVE